MNYFFSCSCARLHASGHGAKNFVCGGETERKAVVFSESTCSAGCKTTSLALENVDRVFVLHFQILGSVGFLKF